MPDIFDKIRIISKYLSIKKKINRIKHYKSEKGRKAGDRIKAVLLNDNGFSSHHIARGLFIDEKTVSRHIKDYQQKLKLKNTYGGFKSKLNRQRIGEAYLSSYPFNPYA